MNWTSDDQRMFRAFKSGLTRAVNRARKLETVDGYKRVLTEVNKFNAYFDAEGRVYPDDWARWQRARDDARYELARLQGAWEWR